MAVTVSGGWVLAGVAAGCVHPAAHERWRLMRPPEVSDAAAPRGTRLLPKAPLGEWHQVAILDSETACHAAKKRDIDREVKRATKELGEEAKFAVPLRRAVSARCVRGE